MQTEPEECGGPAGVKIGAGEICIMMRVVWSRESTVTCSPGDALQEPLP